jgi:hypothetical protein
MLSQQTTYHNHISNDLINLLPEALIMFDELVIVLDEFEVLVNGVG